ncbi:hypothetical protein V9T40_010068 [Parthenolecanium corni]|uniref:Uncharacterized protein n=1 Tax=Parthenolecanium corni TaxID=536013 RepID=A0AAN9Y725_9HEMI
MLGTVLLVVWCTSSVDSFGHVYPVERQDFIYPSWSRSPVYQNLVNGRPGVYKVNRQDFAGNGPFSQSTEPPFDNMYNYYYKPGKVLDPYERVGNGYQFVSAPSTFPPSLLPRLFVPAGSGNEDEAAIRQPNYKDVLSLSEYNRRFNKVPPFSQPSVPPYVQPSVQSQPSVPSPSFPSYFQPPVPSQPSVLSYTQAPVKSYSQPSVLSYTQPPVNPFWKGFSTSPTTLLPPSTTTPSPTSAIYSPLPQAPAVNEEDGVLPPIPMNDEENKPLPPVSAQESLPKVFVTEDTVGNRHTKVKYHSFNEFVEISDEHRELLESFGPIENNESDFAELPEASPIRRRRNASQVFSVFSVRDTGLKGSPVAPRDPEQLIDAYISRLRQQIEILNDMKDSVRNAKHQQQNTKSSPRTIVAADDSTVVVFNSNANFDGKLDDQVGQQNSAEDLSQSSVPLAESSNKNSSNSSEDSLLSSKETNPSAALSTESEVPDASIGGENSSDGSHEVLLQRDEGTDVRPTSNPRDQIIYLTGEPFEVATHSSDESWEDFN